MMMIVIVIMSKPGEYLGDMRRRFVFWFGLRIKQSTFVCRQCVTGIKESHVALALPYVNPRILGKDHFSNYLEMNPNRSEGISICASLIVWHRNYLDDQASCRGDIF